MFRLQSDFLSTELLKRKALQDSETQVQLSYAIDCKLRKLPSEGLIKISTFLSSSYIQLQITTHTVTPYSHTNFLCLKLFKRETTLTFPHKFHSEEFPLLSYRLDNEFKPKAYK